ncbi:MAG: DUF3795 domain-containing protein [Oscillospiraceae bacterium]|nr:DUF3795 domain-containing protein [Oscillospiraceae bacterium]
MSTVCGADCGSCGMSAGCRGCAETDGRPFGEECLVWRCYRDGGKAAFLAYQDQLIREFNALELPDLSPVTQLFPLCGSYINMEYTLPNGQRFKLLRDGEIYLGCQVERPGSERCYGLAANGEHLVVCEYGCGGADPQLVLYKRRQGSSV